LDEQLKDPDGPLRLVFVCAMWVTGFDVPSCSTIYLEKPMKNHTVMQTIARSNRRYPAKEAGVIVDYASVFSRRQEALAIYGGASSQVAEPRAGYGDTPPQDTDTPIQQKAELVEYLKHLLAKGITFLTEKQVDPVAIQAAGGFDKVALLDDAVEKLLESEETKKAFLNLAKATSRVYRAILPDPSANDLAPDAVLLSVLAQKIKALEPEVDITQVMREVDDLLDQSVAPVPYVIEETDEAKLFDLSQIDFEKLKERFNKGKKRTEAEKLRALLNQKLESMVARNPSRTDFMEKLQKLIEKYNSG